MKKDRTCLAPYEISSPNFPGDSGPTFVDKDKARRVAVITPCSSLPNPPQPDAVILNEQLNCPSGNCDIRWYECPSQKGRTYTVIATACNVVITSFENGLIADGNCDGTSFGVDTFCFGKVYTEDGQVFNTTSDCSVVFDFDGLTFTVQGVKSDAFGFFECDDCWDYGEVTAFGAASPDDPGIRDLPTPPPAPTDADEEQTDITVEEDTDQEDTVNWLSQPSGATGGLDIVCSPECAIPAPGQDCGSGATGGKSECESQDNPSIARLPSGHVVIAYEERVEDGSNKISLAVVSSSVSVKIVYFRNLSKGRLINNDSFVYGSGTFEVFDDLLPEVDGDGIPTIPLVLGFLTGPLKGKSAFKVASILRQTQLDGRPKHVISFDTFAREAIFDNSNDDYDISWFLAEMTPGLPGGTNLTTLITLPPHLDDNGIQVPVANPSVAAAENNIMIDTTQDIYVTYQAFVNKKWNVYLQQVRLSEKSAADPAYKAPYLFAPPQAVATRLDGSEFTKVTYRIKDIFADGITLCALFEVFLPDGRQIINCDQETTGTFITTLCSFEADVSVALVEVAYSLQGACGDPGSVPGWVAGTEIRGGFPPTAEIILAGEGDPACVTDIQIYPGGDTSEWCFNESVCTQFYVFDDPYCPSPYTDLIDFTYHPADLWTIKVGDDIITRVLYHMSADITQTQATGAQTDTLDFMFVIDHSGSMAVEIAAVRAAVPILANTLIQNGFNVRFGFVVYARGQSGTPIPGNRVGCTATTLDSYLFDGLQQNSACEQPGSPGGFTPDDAVLQQSLSCWGTQGGHAAPWVAIQFAATDTIRFEWRENAQRFIFLITDTGDTEVPTSGCAGFTNIKQDAINALLNNNITFLVANDPVHNAIYGDIPPLTGWEGTANFDVNSEDYGVIFEEIARSLVVSLSGLRVLERDIPGYAPTFMKPAEALITYGTDLLDLWTYDKGQLKFIDRPPTLEGPAKGLSKTPFSLYDGRIYGVDSVHIAGRPSNWTYYVATGDFLIDYPSIGIPAIGQQGGLLIAEDATRPKIQMNHRNDVFIAYESYATKIPHIEIRGTGDFHYNSITGPAGGRITRFYREDEFDFLHEITLPGEGVNQLCDFVVDKSDITHIVWQSNRDNHWEIYYANSYDLFQPVRITKAESRSAMPRIDVGDDGTIYVVYHDNRFDRYEAFLAFKDERRVLPLTQQDAYLASLRHNYTHYTNILPVLVSNPGTSIPVAGLLWATKISSAEGSGNESYIFAIEDTSVGGKTRGGDTNPYEIVAIAGSRDGFMYGVTKDAKLLLLSEPISEDPYLDLDPADFREIGDLPLVPIPGIGPLVGEDIFDEADGIGIQHAGQWANVCATLFPTVICIADPVHCVNRIVTCVDCPGNNPPHSAGCGFFDQNANTGSFGSYAQVFQTSASSANMSVVAVLEWDNNVNNVLVSPLFKLLARVEQSSITTGYELEIIEPANQVGVTTRVTLLSRDGASVIELRSTQLATVDIPTVFAPDTPVDVRLDAFDELDGSVTLKAYLNDILVLSFNDTVFKYTGPWAGVISRSSALDTGGGIFLGISNELRSFALHNYVPPPNTDTSDIVDISFDQIGRLWGLTADTIVTGGAQQRIIEINLNDATITRETVVFSEITKLEGAINVLSNGTFFVVSYQNGVPQLFKSPYPLLSPGVINFSFNKINNSMNIKVESMTSDHEDTLLAVDDKAKLYTLTTKFGTETLLSDLGGSGTVGANPITNVAGLGYQFTGIFERIGTPGFFHVFIEFYDNIGLLGDPVVVVDSRDNLEAFINMASLEDPYVGDAYFAGANGIFLAVDESGFVFFDASHFRPGFSRLAYPYAFDTNQTYFPRVFIINSAGQASLVNEIQEVSFSCTRCTRLGDNVFDSHGCSYSFVLDDPGPYNLLIDVYGDVEFRNLISRFTAVLGHPDLAFMEVDNKPAVEEWGNSGLTVTKNEPKFVQLYPALDPNSGLLCGVTYYVKVLSCGSPDECLQPDRDHLTEIESARGNFRCECSSNIFKTGMQPLSLVSRWQSSAHGYSDTRVTDSPKDTLKPDIKTRSSGSAIILFDDYNNPDGPEVKGATFRKATDQDDMFSSGTRSWFDYSFNIFGRDADLTIDLYDRVATVYEKPDAVVGRGLSRKELPGNAVFFKSCDFDESSDIEALKNCDISDLTANAVTSDEFISSQVIKKVAIKPDFVDYFTYNASRQVTPVVSDCNIALQIWSTPEVVALRFKNENEPNFSEWCPATPEISDYFTEKEWKLSSGSGVKEVCIQAMTYTGVTAEFCVPIVADYNPVIYETKLYADDTYSEPLPQFNGMFVAANIFDKTTGNANNVRTIYVEIIPNIDIRSDGVNFDIIQQGENDLLDLPATGATGSDGRVVFRGSFEINKEDNVFNKDGLARVRAKFSAACEDDTFIPASGVFEKDRFNSMSEDSQASIQEGVGDSLKEFRQDISGRIGVGITIHPNEDPYFVFGDPNFFLDKKEPNQTGVNQPKGMTGA